MRILILLALLSLTQQLGHPNYGVREKATVQWLAVASNSNPHPVLLWGEKLPDAEIAARCKLVIRTHLENAVDAWTDDLGKLPWIDMLPEDHIGREEIMRECLTEARKQIGTHGPPDWDDYRLATKLYFRCLFLHRLGGDVPPLLAKMEKRQRIWIFNHGGSYTPPIKIPGIWWR